VVEEGLLRRDAALQLEVALERVGVEEVLRGLDEVDRFVLEEADGLPQEAGTGTWSASKWPRSPWVRFSAWLRLPAWRGVVGAGQVERARPRAMARTPRPAVVQQEDLLAGTRWPAPDQRAPDDFDRLVAVGMNTSTSGA
jgi:hypothetical protein